VTSGVGENRPHGKESSPCRETRISWHGDGIAAEFDAGRQAFPSAVNFVAQAAEEVTSVVYSTIQERRAAIPFHDWQRGEGGDDLTE
jgi:hypothetical protein